MSEEITFADMLNHYSLKLSEISDLMFDVVSYLNKSFTVANESWSSDSANSFNDKVFQIQKLINNSNLTMDELMKLLNAAKNTALDNEVNQLKNETEASVNASE